MPNTAECSKRQRYRRRYDGDVDGDQPTDCRPVQCHSHWTFTFNQIECVKLYTFHYSLHLQDLSRFLSGKSVVFGIFNERTLLLNVSVCVTGNQNTAQYILLSMCVCVAWLCVCVRLCGSLCGVRLCVCTRWNEKHVYILDWSASSNDSLPFSPFAPSLKPITHTDIFIYIYIICAIEIYT